MGTIEEYQALVAVLDRGSFTGAARQLGRSLQAVSRGVAELERELGVELIRRTTRRLQATEAGLRFYARMRTALADIAAAHAEATESAATVSGPLRVGGPLVFATVYLVPALDAFLQRHPRVSVDLQLSNEFVDLVAERIDLSVRVGELEDSGLRMRRMGLARRVTFAAPSYLAERGRPLHPQDLSNHDCVVRSSARDACQWVYERDGIRESVRVRGRFTASSADVCTEAVARGLGLGLAQMWQVRPLLDKGRVELVLTEFEPPPVPVSVVWPAGRTMPVRTRLLIDFLVSRLGAERW